jgi:hypothetical protein
VSDKPTVDFGAPEAFGAHVFRVEISAKSTEPTIIIEDYGYQGGENGRPYEEPRVLVPRLVWNGISSTASRNFNDRLKAQNQSTGRWRVGKNLLERLLGKELCVLAWAAERAKNDQLQVICNRWEALRPEERWWLFSMTVAEAGLPGDGERGWRKALYYALSDGERQTAAQPPRKPRPKNEPQSTLSLFPEKP